MIFSRKDKQSPSPIGILTRLNERPLKTSIAMRSNSIRIADSSLQSVTELAKNVCIDLFSPAAQKSGEKKITKEDSFEVIEKVISGHKRKKQPKQQRHVKKENVECEVSPSPLKFHRPLIKSGMGRPSIGHEIDLDQSMDEGIKYRKTPSRSIVRRSAVKKKNKKRGLDQTLTEMLRATEGLVIQKNSSRHKKQKSFGPSLSNRDNNDGQLKRPDQLFHMPQSPEDDIPSDSDTEIEFSQKTPVPKRNVFKPLNISNTKKTVKRSAKKKETRQKKIRKVKGCKKKGSD